jgi:hypothetical protein
VGVVTHGDHLVPEVALRPDDRWYVLKCGLLPPP